MLAKRAIQLNTEKDVAGQSSMWRNVHNLIRYSRLFYNLRPYCQRNKANKKHYKLKIYNLKSIIRHVEQDGILKTHDNILNDIYKQIYVEEQQNIERRQKRKAFFLADFPLINIINVLPSQTSALSIEIVFFTPYSRLKILR